MSINPVHQGVNNPQPRKNESGEVVKKGPGENSGRNLQKSLFQGQNKSSLQPNPNTRGGSGAIQLDISQNVSMGVNKQTAQMFVETKVRTSISAQLSGKTSTSENPAEQMPAASPGEGNLSLEETAGRLVDFARNVLNSGEAENNGSQELDELREAADQGFEKAGEALEESETEGISEMVGEVKNLFMEMLDRLEAPADEAEIEVAESGSAEGQLRQAIEAQNSQAAANTNLSSVLTG